MRQDAEVLGTAPVGAGGHDQPPDAALDFLLQLPLELDRRLLVGLGRQDPDGLRLGRDGVERLFDIGGADLQHIDALALALEEAEVEHGRGVDDVLAAQHHDLVAVLDVGDRQRHVIRLRVLEDRASVIEVRRREHLAEEALEEEELLVAGGR